VEQGAVGRGAHRRKGEGGSVLKTGSRCYVTSPRAQMLIGAAVSYDGAHRRQGGQCQQVRASGNETRQARISAAPRSAGSSREGTTPSEVYRRLKRRGRQTPCSAARARGRARRVGRCDVAACDN
jgi:hypothetical protein